MQGHYLVMVLGALGGKAKTYQPIGIVLMEKGKTMTCLEHYFENLLFYGKDVANDVNKNALTEDERKAVEACAQYVIYVLFGNREIFERWLKRGSVPCEWCQEFDCYGCEYDTQI